MLENIKYANAEHTVISATENGSQLSIPVAVGNKHYDEIVEQNLAIGDYVPPAPTWAGIRGERDNLLAATDWQAGTDVTMTDAQKAYRQSLRDLPQTFSNPEDVVWPTKP